MAEEIKPVIPLKRSQFVCQHCKGQDGQGPLFFFALAGDIQENEKGEFVSSCPQCGEECDELWYCTNLRQAEGKRTGPTSEAGKNKVRMNAFRNGSRYANGRIPKELPPAKPGEYAECDRCQDLDECKLSVTEKMGTCRITICHRQSEISAIFREAHRNGDPVDLQFIAAENQARMQMVLNALFKAIFKRGVLVDSIVVNKDGVVYIDKEDGDGNKTSVPLTEIKSNPATNDMIKLAEKMGFSLTDWTLTPKSKEAKAALEGYLAGRAAEKGQPAEEFLDQYRKDMKAFEDAVAKGNAAALHDETLKESASEEKVGDA